MSPSQSTIGDGYTILPLTIPSIPSYPIETQHTLYLRPHAPKIPSENDARSLFLVNVPIDATSEHIKSIVKQLVGAGRFESVTFDGDRPASKEVVLSGRADGKGNNKKRKRGQEPDEGEWKHLPQIWDRSLHRSGSSAVLVLVDEKSVEGILKIVRKQHKHTSSKEAKWPIWGLGTESKVPALGSARYAAHHTLLYPDAQEINKNVNAFMTAFNTAEEAQKTLDKQRRNMVDEDGFITVSRGGRTGVARQEVLEIKKMEMEEREQRKRGERGDFYRFQGRERRREDAEELVRRFEGDRVRVAKLKEVRGRFRPER